MRSAVALAQLWRGDKGMRQLEAMMIVADKEQMFVLSGVGDVIEPENGIAAIGSGGNYALAAARALAKNTQMSAREIAARAVDAINSQEYDCIIINFANGDMVGHSGDKEAAKIAVGVVDECVKKVTQAALDNGGEIIITADHGNSDIMQYEDGSPHTAQTINLVPVFIVGSRFKGKKINLSGTLADIAPTFLKLLNEKVPKEMTGKPLY